MPALQFKQLSERAMFVQFSTTINEEIHQQIQQVIAILQEQPFPGLEQRLRLLETLLKN